LLKSLRPPWCVGVPGGKEGCQSIAVSQISNANFGKRASIEE
jgi:hypothetical protein